jgi:hypothetical protein
MEKEVIEAFRKRHEQAYRKIDCSAIVVAELGVGFGDVDFETNETIKLYKSKGYKLLDVDMFGEDMEQCGVFLVFVKN